LGTSTQLRIHTNAVDSESAKLSVVVPTRNEAGNVAPLLERIAEACKDVPTEVIFVDDSTDETPHAIVAAAAVSPMSVWLIHRPKEARGDGLGGAVVEGLRASVGDWVAVMDGDLQHPPETLPIMLERARQTDADLVMASRFASTGSAGGLSRARFALSKATGYAARAFFPRRMRGVSDPLTGFFLVRRSAVDPEVLRPRGFKILLEILVRCGNLRVAEVPFQFANRLAGESKANLREGLRYIRLLAGLRWEGTMQRIAALGTVGATGLVVNQVLLAVGTELLGLHYAVSSIFATQGSTAWNFGLTDGWVFRDREAKRGLGARVAGYFAMNNLLLVARIPLLMLLVSGTGLHYIAANVVSILLMAAVRYLICDKWIWPVASGPIGAKRFNYDVHGIVRIASDVRLPELDFFRTPTVGAADLSVSLGGMPSGQPKAHLNGHANGHLNGHANGHSNGSAVPAGPSVFQYRESLGPLGFWVDITRGATTDVVAAPVLKFSPHVLYTNVVEPILRWMLVERGYVLLHGACIANEDNAFLITARTDTGKTSTILRLLAQQPVPFLSDDMMILCPDARVLCYPKPLTISRHTLQAVDGAATLKWWEWLALPLQSRVHSKGGRLLALLLARFPLPMATINTYLQMVIPPPKYRIDQLVPGTPIKREATIVHRIEIERGPAHHSVLEAAAAEETLLRNCDDAYGFPPYGHLEPFLAHANGEDLRQAERGLIAAALAGRGTTLIASQTHDWWRSLKVMVQAATAGTTHATAWSGLPGLTIGSTADVEVTTSRTAPPSRPTMVAAGDA
jgi:dolichol-phosphate mannosyltransferase